MDNGGNGALRSEQEPEGVLPGGAVGSRLRPGLLLEWCL